MIAVGILAYIGIGCCAAAYRAYRDPFIFAREQETSRVSHRSQTLFYSESVFFHFAAWPIALPSTLGLAAVDGWRRRGQQALEARVAREQQAKRDAAEIDRIIAEAKL